MLRLIVCLACCLFVPAQAAEWQQVQVGGLSARLAVGGQGRTPRPLLLVLHGCAQSNAALQQHSALGAAADAAGAVVALPQVPNGGVLAGCWDYYGGAHSRGGRHSGPLLAFTEALLADPELAIDPDRVWIAGLSSGAGQAIVAGCLAPDVFSGVALAGGPGLGTEAGQISQVASSAGVTTELCRRLAGPHVADFARQRAVVVTGDRDFIVAPGYARVNAEGLAAVYGAAQQEPLDLGSLPGAPAGTGGLWLDAAGPRVALIEVAGLDHAWPGGAGSGPTREFVAQGGLDLGAFLLAFFGDGIPEGPEDPEDPEDPENPEDPGSLEDPEDPAPCPAITATLVEHTSRLGVYGGVYGAADLGYVELLNRYGVSTPFALHQGPDGRWYHDPTGLDCGQPAEPEPPVDPAPDAARGVSDAAPLADAGLEADAGGASGCQQLGGSPSTPFLICLLFCGLAGRRRPRG